MDQQLKQYSAFAGNRRIGRGSMLEVALAVCSWAKGSEEELVLFFDGSGHQIDIDWSGGESEVRSRYEQVAEGPSRRGPGRPRLGVVGREVTLLPRHWQWLQRQRRSPSATLRRLVDQAAAAQGERASVERAQDAINRFVSAVGGDLPGFEEATRALYRGDRKRFETEIAEWPADVRGQLDLWLDDAFAAVVE